jgi:hypothetical protein
VVVAHPREERTTSTCSEEPILSGLYPFALTSVSELQVFPSRKLAQQACWLSPCGALVPSLKSCLLLSCSLPAARDGASLEASRSSHTELSLLVGLTVYSCIWCPHDFTSAVPTGKDPHRHLFQIPASQGYLRVSLHLVFPDHCW